MAAKQASNIGRRSVKDPVISVTKMMPPKEYLHVLPLQNQRDNSRSRDPTRSPLISPSFRLNADSSSLNARDALAAAIALHSAKSKKMGFDGLSCRALPFGITGLRTTGSSLRWYMRCEICRSARFVLI